MSDMSIDMDAYYCGTAAERLHVMAAEMEALGREAAARGADRAAFVLSDLATELLDMGYEAGGQQVRREDPQGFGF